MRMLTRQTTAFSVALACASALFVVLTVAERVYAEAAIPSTFRFERTLKTGSRGEDVRYLQILLNRDSETRVNAPNLSGGAGNETTYFGAATRAAVVKFQNKHANMVLAPANLSSGTGLVGMLTRAKLNLLLALPPPPATPAALTPPLPPSPAPSESALPATSSPARSWDEINKETRRALVNVLCTTIRSGPFNPLSASGVIIDPRGLILTNAHVAEYYLLKDYIVEDFVECVIRTGEPARNAYRAKLLYISPFWVQRNYTQITVADPKGTGENDFALLFITETTNRDTPLPSSFPALTMDAGRNALARIGEVLIAGYPAGFLSGINIQKDLYPASSVVPVGEIFGFSELVPDLFSIGGSLLAQKGSSGGAVVNSEGKLIGLIVTSTQAQTTGERDLRAITMGHITRSFKKDTGQDFTEHIAGDLDAHAEKFNTNVAPQLTKLLESALLKRSTD